jgi:uncharacterized protein YyaL (SSP411 family)
VNRLAQETSPYLLQHADNPVDWYPWGEEAFERAQADDKPILLSIGYAACHWCHVMEHESFEDDETARLMNERFVNIKVDREERPDVDALYMDAVLAMTGSGGWPTTVFLTPQRVPFYGGTYYPPEPRHGMPAFRDVLEAISDLYRDSRGEVEGSAKRLEEALGRASRANPSAEPLTEGLLRDAARGLRSQFDPDWGGFGGAPKFPPASALEFLLRMHLRGDEQALPMVTKTLDAMAAGGMYDLVGGGFHRYAVDRTWLVPHFEKMLYDNALLASAYLHGWVVTGNENYRRVVEDTIGYVLRELSLPEGAFASAQDADTDGVEGLTFTWTADEGVPEELLQPFEDGRSIIRGELDGELRRRLHAIREERPKPMRDDKAIASWNGLMLAALAEAGRRLDRHEWLEAATRLAEFLLGPLSDDEGRLYRTYREGRAKNTGFLEDYADVVHGLYELHVATGELRWLEEANRLARLAVALFADEERGGFFLTPIHGEQLISRQKSFDDHPTPSGNSMLALDLLRLARIYGDEELARRAVGVFRLMREALARAPHAFGHALSALDLHFSPPRELAVLGSVDSEVARAALEPFQPNTVVAVGPGGGIPLLEGKELVDGRPAVYVCERFVCRAPTTDPRTFRNALQTSN